MVKFVKSIKSFRRREKKGKTKKSEEETIAMMEIEKKEVGIHWNTFLYFLNFVNARIPRLGQWRVPVLLSGNHQRLSLAIQTYIF